MVLRKRPGLKLLAAEALERRIWTRVRLYSNSFETVLRVPLRMLEGRSGLLIVSRNSSNSSTTSLTVLG